MTGARNGEAELEYETFGRPGGRPLLLISGMVAQLTMYPVAFCRALADAGFQVIRVRVPVLALHGDRDPMMSLKAARATAAAVPGARLVVYPGMGHDLPRQLWPAMIEEIRRTTGEGEQPAPSGTGRSPRDPVAEEEAAETEPPRERQSRGALGCRGSQSAMTPPAATMHAPTITAGTRPSTNDCRLL